MIDPKILTAQHQAINPKASVWLAASAGSGKTKVLIDRVLNLLLKGTEPDKILCLTFTKAAAKEMSNRISNKLKEWATCSQEKLLEELSEFCDYSTPSNEIYLRARELFVNVLETPGSMKILTIHAFCQSVLKRFPIEAGISPQFEVLEEKQADTLMQEAFENAFADTAYQNDLWLLSDYIQDNRGKDSIFKEILSKRDDFERLFEKYPHVESIKNILKKKYNFEKYHSEKDIVFNFCSQYFQDVSPELYLEAFTNAKSTYLTGSSLRKKYESLPEGVDYYETYQHLLLFKAIELTVSLLRIIKHILQQYAFFKKESGALDFTDLIEITKKLISNTSDTTWVMYKLDGGIDHILVDEAQDTNPEQWEIVRLLCEEFFSGLGREGASERTLFVVGDKKQSIFSFQGADPRKFEEMRLYFQKKIRNANKEFTVIPLNHSFRSTPPVLEIVNNVLNNPDTAQGVKNVGEDVTHRTANRQESVGLIEIWKPILLPKQEKDTSHWPLLERQSNNTPIALLADKIANKIKSFFDNKECLFDEKKKKYVPIQPKDITILVRSRSGSIMVAIVNALKKKNIPVAGVDRLDLLDNIAILDLMSLAKFSLLPEDDLNLATLLKSPFIGINENKLMDLCVKRGETTLWEAICRNEPEIASFLRQILNLADKMPAYEFFATVLGVFNGRQKLISRLGLDSMETVDEFLALTLKFEENETPSLQNFITWFENRSSIIKRDMEQDSKSTENTDKNTVKIMTVHGSKGLENKIVFIANAQNSKTLTPKFLWDENNIPLWVPRSDMAKVADLSKMLDAFLQKNIEEENRLLYVALTRARDRLYICGWYPKNITKDEEDKKTWLQMIRKSLPKEQQAYNNDIIRLPYDFKPFFGDDSGNKPSVEDTLPNWVNQPAPEESPLSKPLMPSRLIENENPEGSLTHMGREKAMRRGTFIHQLLQYLPDIEPQKQKEIALKLKPQDIDLPSNLFDIFTHPVLKYIFSPHSQAEVPVVGVVGGKVFSGQIDRLVILENEVLIIDYKTSSHVPNTPQEVSKTYIMQLSAYKNLISKIFPDKLIKTFLLWTENMSLMEMTSETNIFDN